MKRLYPVSSTTMRNWLRSRGESDRFHVRGGCPTSPSDSPWKASWPGLHRSVKKTRHPHIYLFCQRFYHDQIHPQSLQTYILLWTLSSIRKVSVSSLEDKFYQNLSRVLEEVLSRILICESASLRTLLLPCNRVLPVMRSK